MSQVTQEQNSIFHTLTSEAGLKLNSNGPHELGKNVKAICTRDT